MNKTVYFIIILFSALLIFSCCSSSSTTSYNIEEEIERAYAAGFQTGIDYSIEYTMNGARQIYNGDDCDKIMNVLPPSGEGSSYHYYYDNYYH